jgi:hypothetical protein
MNSSLHRQAAFTPGIMLLKVKQIEARQSLIGRSINRILNDQQVEPMVKSTKKMPIKVKDAKRDWSDLTALIRGIQRAEGNLDCFGRPPDDCDQFNCKWRRYCLEELTTHYHDEHEQQSKENQPVSQGYGRERNRPRYQDGKLTSK